MRIPPIFAAALFLASATGCHKPGASGDSSARRPEAKVVAINRDWNFVVLDLGANRGLADGATLAVTRGGRQICKVRITEIEPTTSVADVLAGFHARSLFPRPGDYVIFPGT